MPDADYLVGVEEYELAFVEDVLDDSPVDAQTVYKETIEMSERAIAAVAALRSSSGETAIEQVGFPAAADVRYVAGSGAGLTGSDSNTGLTPATAYATIQAAYDSLPTEGGTLILLNGRHNVGSGFVGASRKGCVMTSLTGYVPNYRPPGLDATSYLYMPVIYGSGATLLKVNSGTPAGIANGWAFLGLGFDMTTSGNLAGIWVEDTNWGRVRGCIAEASHGQQAHLLKTTSPLYDDCSQWRIEDNHVRNVGLCTMNDGATDGNCNNNQVINNCIFGGVSSDFTVKLAVASRCLVMGNEVAITGGFVRYLGASHYNHTFFNGGEDVTSPFVQYDSGAYGNLHFNYGTTGGAATGSEINVQDLDGANASAVGNQSFKRTTDSIGSDKTDDYTLTGTGGSYYGNLIEMNKASAVNFTIDTHANQQIQIGSFLRVRQKGAGQVTIVPAGGVTLNAAAGLKTRAQYSVIQLEKIAVNTWIVWGDTHLAPGAGSAGGVLGGTYPNPSFAVDMATQAELDALSSVYQPLDSDLTSIAALATTSYGRAFLALADAAAARAAAAAAPVAAKYIVQTADSELSAEQALGALGTGVLKSTTSTGVLSIAAGSDLPTGIPIASLADPTTGKVIGSVSSAAAAVYPPGYQFGVIERASSNFTTTQTTQASADTALTMASITFDGSTLVEFLLTGIGANSATSATIFNLWEDSTDKGPLGRAFAAVTGANQMVNGRMQFTPTAGAKVYTIRGWVQAASTGTLFFGNGTTLVNAMFTIRKV